MSDDQTSTTTSTAPRWPLVVVVVVLLPLAVLGSAVLSGAGTLALFADAGFPVKVQPFGLGMVEVLSLAGTLLRIFATGDRLRRDALVAVLVATAVSVVAGWKAYGPAGVLAGVFLVGLVHLAAEAWLELRARPTASSTTPARTPAADAPASSSSEEAEQAPEAPAELPVDELDQEPTTGGIVYRLWSAKADLLYVGSTYQGRYGLTDRLAEHRMKTWGPEIATWTLEEHATRDDATTAEIEAIRAERPLHNRRRYTGELGPIQGPQTLVEYLRELDELPSERELAKALTTDHTTVTRHAARTILIEVRSGLSAVSA